MMTYIFYQAKTAHKYLREHLLGKSKSDAKTCRSRDGWMWRYALFVIILLLLVESTWNLFSMPYTPHTSHIHITQTPHTHHTTNDTHK